MYTHSMLDAHGLRWYCVHTNDTVPMLHLGIQSANRVTLPYSVYIFALLVCLFVRWCVWGVEKGIHRIIQLRLLCACLS